ncbi:hypothetical protein [Actinoplanes sp. HUAS TT8]|uniref:hypothetical protein n=1 Tax=Actinoplanes sp. HUAS TT8 TaxID=3447453 RepID=UPI003F527371
MDPVAASVAATLFSAVATDSWEAAKSAVVALWRRTVPEQAELVESDLVLAERRLVTARPEQAALVGDLVLAEWQARLQLLLLAHPEVSGRLARFADGEWGGDEGDSRRTGSVSMSARSADSSKIFQAGGDLHVHG